MPYQKRSNDRRNDNKRAGNGSEKSKKSSSIIRNGGYTSNGRGMGKTGGSAD